jgi:predicted O-methyltransferase YrrM
VVCSRPAREVTVSARQPANLVHLYDAFGREAIDAILPGDTFCIDGIEFVCKYVPESTPSRLYIVKPIALVDRYRELCAGPWAGGVIFELGVAEGGSTALLALLASPKRLIAIDLEPQPLQALAGFVEDRRLGDTMRLHYGIDQASREQLTEILDADVGDQQLDVVIDDASHRLAETRTSFEVLFPRLRPGGYYVIEDWNPAHTMRDAIRAALEDESAPHHRDVVRRFRESLGLRRPTRPEAPLSRLAIELVLARAGLGDAVESVTVDEHWLTVRRGSAELDGESFSLGDLYRDYFGYLPPD